MVFPVMPTVPPLTLIPAPLKFVIRKPRQLNVRSTQIDADAGGPGIERNDGVVLRDEV